MYCKRFCFDIRNTANYSDEIGYGAIDPLSIQNRSETDSDAALKCGGWNSRRLAKEKVDASEKNQYNQQSCKNRHVAIFRIDVPEFGTYRIETTITTTEKDIDGLNLFAGRRNMIADNFSVKRAKSFNITFYQAVTPYIPALRSERSNDRCIFLSISGIDDIPTVNRVDDLSCVSKVDGISGVSRIDVFSTISEGKDLIIDVTVSREDVPIIWVAGDSTLTDQNAGIPYYPYGSCSGWAQTLSRFIKNAAVCNLAHSGMTSNCFRDDGHYDIVKEMIKPGDFFIMQFGHNDQKRRNLSAFGGYKENLEKYVAEMRSLGATPIICSPISRIPLTLAQPKSTMQAQNLLSEPANGESNTAKEITPAFYSLLSSYAKACEEAAKETNSVFINLHKLTFDKWTSNIDAAKDFFIPGDITHTNEYGSLLISGFFIAELRRLSRTVKRDTDLPDTQNSKDNKADYQCHPDSMSNDVYAYNCALSLEQYDNQRAIENPAPSEDTKELPKELPGPDIFSMEPPYVDIKGIAEYDDIKKAFKYGLLDPCVMYLHPYATMPRAQLLMVMFKAFRIPGVRPYTGVFKDIFYDEWDSGYVQALINESLISTDDEFYCPEGTLAHDKLFNPNDTINQYSLFRPDDALTYWEFASFLIRFLEPDHSKTLSLTSDICVKKAEELGIMTTCKISEKADAISNNNSNSTSSINNNNHFSNSSITKGHELIEKYELATGDKITRAEVYSALARFMDIIGAAADALPSDAEIHPVH